MELIMYTTVVVIAFYFLMIAVTAETPQEEFDRRIAEYQLECSWFSQSMHAGDYNGSIEDITRRTIELATELEEIAQLGREIQVRGEAARRGRRVR